MSVDDVVISGMSGRFPMADTTDEFAGNLFAGVDMVTEDDTRWPTDIFNVNNRFGKILTYNRFDSTFFGLTEAVVNNLDPQGSMQLETVYEAIVDAGVNPNDLRGTKTGVYVGAMDMSVIGHINTDMFQPDIPGNLQSHLYRSTCEQNLFYASRISFVFDLKGPSMIVDTACSSSATAFEFAYIQIMAGRLDTALVVGTNMQLDQSNMRLFQELGMCSPRGVSAPLDREADGYVKSEVVGCLLLQRRANARRVYAAIRAVRVNNDGYKMDGMFHPSDAAQEELIADTVADAGINPLDVTYIEGHLTSTKVGDVEEVKAIYSAYCKIPGRKTPLPIGALKSNLGHTEASSGLASIIKVLISYENECIPPNINLNQLKDELAAYFPPLMSVSKLQQYVPGMGGTNAHIILEPNYKLLRSDGLRIAQTIPRIVNICGRTQQSVKHIMDFIE
ncbi:unnamed protein product, partial [Oppiella nova]